MGGLLLRSCALSDRPRRAMSSAPALLMHDCTIARRRTVLIRTACSIGVARREPDLFALSCEERREEKMRRASSRESARSSA